MIDPKKGDAYQGHKKKKNESCKKSTPASRTQFTRKTAWNPSKTQNPQEFSGWWFGTMEFYDFPFSWECHHPN